MKKRGGVPRATWKRNISHDPSRSHTHIQPNSTRAAFNGERNKLRFFRVTCLVGQVECFIPRRGEELSGLLSACKAHDTLYVRTKITSPWHVCLSPLPGLLIEIFGWKWKLYYPVKGSAVWFLITAHKEKESKYRLKQKQPQYSIRKTSENISSIIH